MEWHVKPPIYTSDQIIATSHDLTPNGGLVREIPLFQGNLGWWNIIIWPDTWSIAHCILLWCCIVTNWSSAQSDVQQYGTWFSRRSFNAVTSDDKVARVFETPQLHHVSCHLPSTWSLWWWSRLPRVWNPWQPRFNGLSLERRRYPSWQ